jgi:integrase
MADLQHLYRHGIQYYYDRKIPVALSPYMPEPFTGKARYRVKIGTSDLGEAQRARAIHGAQFELALEKARRAKEGKGEDDTVRQIDALALQLHALEEDAPLPDEAIEGAVRLVPTPLRQRFWKVKNEGKAPAPITDKLEEWIAHTDEIGDRTKLERRTAIKDFAMWFKGGLDEVTRETAKDYRKHLQTKIIPSTQRPMAPATINKRLQALSLYWQYLEEDKVIADGSVWKGLQKKRGRRINLEEGERSFTEAEVKSLFTGKPDQRMLDAMTIAFFTGAREGEIGNMKVSHIDLDKKAVKVPGTKNDNAPRLIPMHDALVPIFERRVKGKTKTEWLIEDLPDPSTLKHGRERGATLSQAFTRYRRKVGVDRVIEGKRNAQTTFHSFRHYVATKLKEAGVAEEVRDALQGWARGGEMRDRYAVSADMMRLMREALGHLTLPS